MTRNFVGHLLQHVLQLHNDPLLRVDDAIVVADNEELQFTDGQDVLSTKGNEHVRCTGLRAEHGGVALV